MRSNWNAKTCVPHTCNVLVPFEPTAGLRPSYGDSSKARMRRCFIEVAGIIWLKLLQDLGSLVEIIVHHCSIEVAGLRPYVLWRWPQSAHAALLH